MKTETKTDTVVRASFSVATCFMVHSTVQYTTISRNVHVETKPEDWPTHGQLLHGA